MPCADPIPTDNPVCDLLAAPARHRLRPDGLPAPARWHPMSYAFAPGAKP